MRVLSRSLLLGAFVVTAVVVSQTNSRSGPVFTKDGDLVLPTGFRSWAFMGAAITPNGLNNGEAPFPEFHDVYIERENLLYYQRHGNFPEGTVLVKELVLTQKGKYPDGSIDSTAGRGYFQGELQGIDVMVKDSKRFADTNNWGFFTFGHHAPPYSPSAKVMPSGQCATCHIAGVAKTDMVWVHYYPLLRAQQQ
ncbi:MAG: cytochrome P460 family protein [Paludibaculum sp.]